MLEATDAKLIGTRVPRARKRRRHLRLRRRHRRRNRAAPRGRRRPGGDSAAYVSVVRAVLAAGALASGIETGVESANASRRSPDAPPRSVSPAPAPTAVSSGSPDVNQSSSSSAPSKPSRRRRVHQADRQEGQRPLPAGRDNPDHLPQDRLRPSRSAEEGSAEEGPGHPSVEVEVDGLGLGHRFAHRQPHDLPAAKRDHLAEVAVVDRAHGFDAETRPRRTRSKAVGVPPRWMCPRVVTRAS